MTAPTSTKWSHSAIARIRRFGVPALPALGLVLLLLLFDGPEGLAAQSMIEQSWENVQDAGGYEFNADVTQIVRPVASIANVGRQSKRDQLYLKGRTDLDAESMEMTLWMNGGSVLDESSGSHVRVQGDKAQVRQGTQPWQEIDDFTGLFAPGGDFLSYLAAFTKAESHGIETRAGIAFTRLAFEIDGPTYARLMRDQMQAEMRRNGELPSGVSLGIPEQYETMTGSGELWIDSQGLPIRQSLSLRFSPEREEQVSAEIRVDFTGFGTVESPAPSEMALSAALGPLLTILPGADRIRGIAGVLREAAQQSFSLLIASLFIACVCTALIRARQGAAARAVLNISLIFAIVATPLFHSYEASEFFDRRAQLASAASEDRESSNRRARAADSMQSRVPYTPVGTVDEIFRDSGSDVDGDGYTDVQERFLGTPPNLGSEDAGAVAAPLQTTPDLELPVDDGTDTDEDGLTDYVEALIGTLASDSDTDGDRVSDYDEVIGFTVAGEKWYTNPLEIDTNFDGLSDGQEWYVGNPNGDQPANTDASAGDQTPDLFDDDNDGDGVPDRIDLSPYSKGEGVHSLESPFSLVLDELSPGKITYVEYQLRPTDPETLRYAYNVLDWPEDRQGHIQDADQKTWADISDDVLDDKFDAGDLELLPMLEVTLPDGIDRSNLPPDSILGEYGLKPETRSGGAAVVHVPLNLVVDDRGEKKVAFNAKMVYQGASDWGAAHQVRLVWMVQGLNDVCSSYDEDGLCEAYSAYNQPQVITKYYDDWTLTGLNVHENQWTDMATIFEDPAIDPDLEDDSTLWDFSYGAGASFLEAGYDSETRVPDFPLLTPPGAPAAWPEETLETLFDHDANATADALVEPVWGLTNTLSFVQVKRYSHADEALIRTSETTTPTLTAHFSDKWSPAEPISPTLMFARQDSFRKFNLDDRQLDATFESVVDWSLNQSDLRLTLAPDLVRLDFAATLSWAPWMYDGSAWKSYPLDQYLDDFGTRVRPSTASYLEAEGIVGPEQPQAISGAVLLLQAYFSYFYTGESRALLADIEPSSDSPWLPDGGIKQAIAAGAGKVGMTFLNKGNAHYSQLVRINSAANGVNEAGELLSETAKVKAEISALKKSTAGFVAGVFIVVLTVAVLKYFGAAYAGTVGGDVASGAAAGILVGVTIYTGIYKGVQKAIDIVNKAATSASTGLSTLSFGKALVSTGTITNFAKGMFVLGLVIAFGIVWGVFIDQVSALAAGSLEFNQLLAGAIAQTIVAVILAVISLTPLGAILVAILVVIDLILAEVFKKNPPQIVKTITEGIAKAIYHYELTVDVKAINVAPPDLEVVKPGRGFVDGETLKVTLPVETVIETANVDDRAAIYASLDTYTGSGLARTSYRYSLTDVDPVKRLCAELGDVPAEDPVKQFCVRLDAGTLMEDSVKNLCAGLDDTPAEDPVKRLCAGLGEMSSRWVGGLIRSNAIQSFYRGANTEKPHANVTLRAGVNRPLSLYLNTGYAVPGVECWFIGVGYNCEARVRTDISSSDVGSSIVIDVLPATFGEFAKLDWGGPTPFGAQRDHDGDGLLSGAYNGNDPNDRDDDVDDDGLSDRFERLRSSEGDRFILTDRNSDDDDLCDADELRFGTDPGSRDSDGDGLDDDEEVWHRNCDTGEWEGGWDFSIVYTDTLGTPNMVLTTRIFSNPLEADIDRDGLDDLAERTLAYPYHPAVPNESPIAVSFEFDDDDRFVAPDQSVVVTSTVRSNLLSPQWARGMYTMTAFGGQPLTREFDLASSQTASLSAQPVELASGRYEVGLEYFARIHDGDPMWTYTITPTSRAQDYRSPLRNEPPEVHLATRPVDEEFPYKLTTWQPAKQYSRYTIPFWANSRASDSVWQQSGIGFYVGGSGGDYPEIREPRSYADDEDLRDVSVRGNLGLTLPYGSSALACDDESGTCVQAMALAKIAETTATARHSYDLRIHSISYRNLRGSDQIETLRIGTDRYFGGESDCDATVGVSAPGTYWEKILDMSHYDTEIPVNDLDLTVCGPVSLMISWDDSPGEVGDPITSGDVALSLGATCTDEYVRMTRPAGNRDREFSVDYSCVPTTAYEIQIESQRLGNPYFGGRESLPRSNATKPVGGLAIDVGSAGFLVTYHDDQSIWANSVPEDFDVDGTGRAVIPDAVEIGSAGDIPSRSRLDVAWTGEAYLAVYNRWISDPVSSADQGQMELLLLDEFGSVLDRQPILRSLDPGLSAPSIAYSAHLKQALIVYAIDGMIVGQLLEDDQLGGMFRIADGSSAPQVAYSVKNNLWVVAWDHAYAVLEPGALSGPLEKVSVGEVPPAPSFTSTGEATGIDWEYSQRGLEDLVCLNDVLEPDDPNKKLTTVCAVAHSMTYPTSATYHASQLARIEIESIPPWKGTIRPVEAVTETLTVDGDAPTSQLTSLDEGQSVRIEDQLILGGDASDATSYVTRVEVQVDGGAWLPAEGSPAWAFSLRVDPARADGPMVVKTRAFDAVGNEGTESSTTINLDRRPPAITVDETADALLPATRDVDGRWHVSFSGTAVDPSSVSSVEIKVAPSGTGWQPALIEGSDWTVDYLLSAFDVSGEPVLQPTGAYTLSVRATDGVINTTASESILDLPFRLDTTPPEAALTSPDLESTSLTGPQTITGEFEDPGSLASGVDLLQIDFVPTDAIYDRQASRFDFSRWSPDWASVTVDSPGSSSSTWSHPLPELEGSYLINLRGTDRAGNRNEKLQSWDTGWQGEIDTRAPRVLLTAALQGIGSSAKTRIEATIEDRNLTEDGLEFLCPVQREDRGYDAADADALIDYGEGQARLRSLQIECEVEGHLTEPVTLRVFDRFGLETESSAIPAAGLLEGTGQLRPSASGTGQADRMSLPSSTVLTPADQSVITDLSTAPTVEGGASADAGLKTLALSVDGVVVHTESWPEVPLVTDALWQTTAWAPPGEGVYELVTELVDWAGNTQTELQPVTVYVDTSAPTVALDSTVVSSAQRLSVGRFELTGTAADTLGLESITVSIDGAPAEPVDLSEPTWRYVWAPLSEPDGEQVSIVVEAKDRARTATVLETLTVDAAGPEGMEVESRYAAIPVEPGQTLRDASGSLISSWTAASDGSGLAGYRVGWTNDSQLPAAPSFAPLSFYPDALVPHSAPVGEATVWYGHAIALDGFGNQSAQTIGPIYVDAPTTPDFIDPTDGPGGVYRGWMDSGCSLVGADYELSRSALQSAALSDVQKLFATWDADHLRLAWTGADWAVDGDLFVYLDSLAGGSTMAYNPYGAGAAVALPDEGGGQMAADYLVYVEDGGDASLLRWNGSDWALDRALTTPNFAFDARDGEQTTDLMLPLAWLGSPSALKLLALASEEDRLRLWSAMPDHNPLNSEQAVNPLALTVLDASFALTQHYEWSDVGASGVCPSTGQFEDAALSFRMTSEPGGISVGYRESDLPGLTPPGTPLDADLDGVLDMPLPLDVSPAPVGQGVTIEYTLHYENAGSEDATGVRLGLTALGGLSNLSTSAIDLGTVAAGISGTLSFTADVAPALDGESAELRAEVVDASHAPFDWLWVQHDVDSVGPTGVEILHPVTYVRPWAETPVRGVVSDASAVPEIILRVDGGATQSCIDPTPTDGEWTCLWDSSAAAEGATIQLDARGRDLWGNVGGFGPVTTLVVDTVAPTVSIDAETLGNLSDGLLLPGETLLRGRVSDNRRAQGADICALAVGETEPECVSVPLSPVGQASGTWLANAPIPVAADNESFTLTIYGIDSAGNRSAPITTRITADLAGPAIGVGRQLSAIEQNNTRTVLAGTVADGAGVASLTLQIHRPADADERSSELELVPLGTGPDWSYSTSFEALGAYDLGLVAVDENGNESFAGLFVLTVGEDVVDVIDPPEIPSSQNRLGSIDVSVSYPYFDPATMTAEWAWGDGTASQADWDSTQGTLSGSHRYDAVGNFTIQLTIRDLQGEIIGYSLPGEIVIYDPDLEIEALAARVIHKHPSVAAPGSLVVGDAFETPGESAPDARRSGDAPTALNQGSMIAHGGDEILLDLEVFNNSTITAPDTEVDVLLPSVVRYVSDTDSCQVSGLTPTGGEILRCRLGDVPAFGRRAFSITVEVDSDLEIRTADGSLVIRFQAQVSSPFGENDPDDNVAVLEILLQEIADLEITKSADPHPIVIAGEELIYRLTVRNLGESDATRVIMTDSLPPELIYLADDGGCDASALPQLVCDLDVIGIGKSKTVLIKTRVSADTVVAEDGGTQVIRNTAEVDSEVFDSSVANNAVEHSTFVQESADLKIIKIVEPHTGAQAGEQFTYTLLVDNLGISAARNVVVTDTLVASGFVRANGCSLAVRTDGGAIDEFDCNFALSTGVFDLATFGANWLMPRSPSDMGRMIITINAFAEQALDLTNTTTVVSDTPDPNSGNNMAMVPLEVAGTADLELVVLGEEEEEEEEPESGAAQPQGLAGIQGVPNPVLAGEQVVSTFTTTNNGPSNALNAFIEASLPGAMQVIDVVGFKTGNVPAGCVAGTPGNPSDPAVCAFGTLAPGQTGTMVVTMLVLPDAVDDPVTDSRLVQVDARSGSDTFDSNLSNNFGFDAITINAEADLALTKFAVGNAVAGEAFHYELQIDNLGPSVSRDVSLRDFLPDGVRFVNAFVDIEGGTGGVPLACDVLQGSNVLWCPLGDIPPTNGVPVYVFVNVMIDADVLNGTVLTNDADIFQTDTPDPDLANNSDDATVNVQSIAELFVEKTAAQLDPVAGKRLRYTVAVRNDGPSDAINVLVDDILPAGYNFVQDSDVCTAVSPVLVQCRPAGAAPTWTLPAGQTATFDILVELDQDIAAGTDATNEACALADNAATACATADTTTERVADLRIRKFGKPDRPVQAGELLTYTVFVDNLGPSFTGPVFVTEELVSDGAFYLTALDPEINNTAPGVTYDDTQIACDYLAQDPADNSVILFQGTVRGDGLGALAAPIGPIPGHLRLTCRFEDPNGLPVFDPVDGTGRWTYRYIVRADDELDINNLASVTGADPDPDFSNNQADTAHAYDAVADLAITKDDLGIVQGTGCPAAAAPMPAMAGMVTAGKTIQWTVNITNTGPSTARNVKFLDRLPPWVRVTAVTAAGGAGSCSTGEAGNVLDQLRCGIGDLAAGASATAVIDAVVDPSAPEGFILENDIMVMSDTRDDNNANDFDSTLTTVKTAADLRIEKMDMPDPVKAGEALWYTLRVTNDGPSDAKFVVLTDTLPAEVTFVSAAVTKLSKVPGMCMAKNQVVTCALGTIPAGHFGEVLIKTTVRPDVVPPGLTSTTITNNAVTSSMTFDPCAANNTVAEPTTVQRLSDVFVTKTDDPDPVNAGDVVTYTVTFGNNGPSTATSVAVVDVLPAGLSFVGCAPSTPADLVTCTEGPAGTVTLNEILAAGAAVWQDAPPASALNDLDPGETYSFQIVALVDSGYVLDGLGDTGAGQACEALATATGYPHFAHNAVTISAAFFDMMAGVPAVQTNTHDECTRVNGLADLAIDKTDIFGDPAANPDNYFLECDPVEPGGMITYMLTITNDGPSDAAQVVVMDWLPEGFVAVDPAQVMIEIENGAGMVEEVRDTGKITLVIGNDDGLLGRLNAGNSVKVTIRVMVRQDAECGGIALNTAMVTTRALVGPPAVTSPTPDDDLANNMDTETTTIECPKVTVKKTVSYDGTCPGVDFATINQIGPGATYCYEITNSGTTYLDHIRITDTLRARTNGMPVIAFTDTIRHGLDPKVPVAPGETVRRQHTVGPLNKECGRVTNEVIVTANPVNSGRTDLPCLETVTASDDALIEVPCAGVDWRLQLPTLDTEVCDSWVQVQNVGDNDTMVLLVAWGDAGFCPPQAAGPLKAECSGLLRPGSAWSFTASQIPTGAKSAVLYSLSAERVRTEAGGRLPFGRTVCEEFFFGVVGDDFAWAEFDSAYRERYPWRGLDFSTYHGEPIAASVNRSCPDPEDPNLTVNAAYTGISSDLEGARDPRSGSFAFFAPLVFAGQNGMNSQIHIQNSGTECTSLELWMKAQDNCMRPTLADVLSLAPGETVTFDPNTVVGPDWLGSAWVRSTQPLGLVVDTLAGNHFTSYNGFAADIHDYGFSVGNMISYVPLIYSEYQGWDTAIQVQNLSAITAAKVKVYFLDRSGDVITTLVDWVCPYGSQTFFLPVLSALPGNWVGSARVESQEWWAPGQPLVEPPRIASVALMEKWADPARTSRREAVAYNGSPECLLYDWQIADGTKGGLSSGSAVFAIPLVAKGNRGITSEIGITNLVPKPGFTDFAMFFYDQNGLLDHVCQKLNEKQVEYINLDSWGFVHNGFLGSMVVSAVFWEHDVFDSRGRFQRNLVGLGGVAVERIGGVLGGQDVPGDESKAFEAFPVFDHFGPEDWLGEAPRCPGQPGFGP